MVRSMDFRSDLLLKILILFRCSFVLLLLETIQKGTMKEGEFCSRCDTTLMDVDFNKIEDDQEF